jgi:hypothetical protein
MDLKPTFSIHRCVFCAVVISITLLTFRLNAETVTDPVDSLKTGPAFYKPMIAAGVYFTAALFVLLKIWYSHREVIPFHFNNDNKGYLQVDKFGHAFGGYAISYIGYHWMLSSGMSKNKALIYGGALGLILQTPIEIVDGLHEGLGFSWGDMAANAFGSGLVAGQALLFERQIVKYKFSFHNSPYARQANGYLGTNTLNRLFEDYNGHTYWISMPANMLFTRSGLPDWLNIAAGYSANGMFGEFQNITSYNGVALPETQRYRQFLFSLDIDWPKIETGSGFLKTVLHGMTFIKLPFPAIEYNSKGRFKGYWLYF